MINYYSTILCLSYHSSFDRSSSFAHEEHEGFTSKEFEARAENKENRSDANHRVDDQLEGKVMANDISVDSLDMSFGNNTSELLMKCTEQDKKNYTIAFEGSINASQEFMDLNQQKRLSHFIKSNSQLNYMTNLQNNRKMIRSEYLNTARDRSKINDRINHNINCKSDRLILDIDRSIAKLSQSIPNMKSLMGRTAECRIPYCPVSGFMPLYDLQSSQSTNSHSSSSEFSPPRSLVKMFLQNRTSPLSSGQISPSLSYESHSQESASGNTSDSSFRPNYYNGLETNNNIDFDSENGILKTGLTEEEILSNEENFPKNRYRFDSQKCPYSLKHTFPIKEVDETMSDSSNTDINMSSIDGFELNTHFSDMNKNAIHSHNYINKSNNVLNDKYSNTSNPNALRTSSSTQSMNNTKEMNSTSSGYISTRFGFESLNAVNNRAKHQKYYSTATTRTTSTQIPVHIEDKEVQASLLTDNSLKFVVRENANAKHTNGPTMTSESPHEYKKPLYVYYPNYSLPDLSFLEEILEVQCDNKPKTVYLSPTKHQLPNRVSVPVKMRQTNGSKSKCRPKSYTDYETLSKQNFSHIKDWDSLNILLPNEFKEFIQKTQNVANPKTDTNNSNNSYKESDIKNNSYVRMRSHKSNVQLTDSNHYLNRGHSRTKRYSLQEPYSAFSQQQTECCNTSNVNIGCISRSQTMPNCRNACHCHQHCYHNCCHSCCHSPCHSPSNASAKPFPQTSSFDINMSSIDKLCQLLAMDLSFKKMMNIINGQNSSANLHNFETVPEVKEEYLFNNNNNNSEDILQNKSVEEMSNKDGSNFKELRKHWETLATSPGSSTNTLTHSLPKKESNETKEKPKDSKDSCEKPVVAKKPQLVLRRPLSYNTRPTTLNTKNPVISHRKSMIPVPKSGQTKSPTVFGTKIKSNIAFK